MPLIFIVILGLASCRDQTSEVRSEDPPPETRVSYSLEVRPFLIANCLSCHPAFPLHDPSGWNLLHPHEGSTQPDHPDFLKKWLTQGAPIDPHWADLPLRRVAGSSVDDFVALDHPRLTGPRSSPGPIFTAAVPELLAGDLMADPSKAIATGYLRQGDDSPEWRVEKVAREFLGIRISCAKCHDHPSEPWSTAHYQNLREIFTTPYDSIPGARPPLHVRETAGQAAKRSQLKTAIQNACVPSPVPEKEFQAWLAEVGPAPQIPGLVAAYSFDDRQLTNLAPTDGIEASGHKLIVSSGAHGLGLYFDGQNHLSLSGVPTGTDRDRFTFSTWVKLERQALHDTPVLTIGEKSRGFELRIVGGKLQARWTQVWPQLAIATTSTTALFVPGRWTHLVVTYDGTRRAEGLKLYLNGHALETHSSSSELLHSVLAGAEPWRFSGKGLTLDEVQIYAGDLTPAGVRQLFDGRSLATAPPDELRTFYQRHVDPAESSRRQKITGLIGELLELERTLKIFLVMAHSPNRPSPGDSQMPRDRLDFAQNLNPDRLARSLANEVWKRHFNTPLAHSLGFSDALPGHPELLEWLAGQLKENDFDVDKLGTMIRASEAWQREWPPLSGQAATCPIKER